MSIINDALKKVENEKQGPQNKASLTLRRLFFASAAIVCLLGIIFATIILPGRTNKNITAPDAKSPQSTFYQRKIDIEIPHRTSDFRLTGILFDVEKPLAIINERIVGEGALIGGAQILEIQPSSVKLSREGKEFTLKVK